MKRGPKPKPNVLRVLDGSTLPINENAPEPSPGSPVPPPTLSRESADEWNRLVPALDAVGLLSTVDRGQLVIVCDAWAQYAQATRSLRELGPLVTPQRASPWLKIQQDAAKLYNRLASEFGLSPGSRMTLKVGTRDTPLEKRSRLDEMLG